eukprot:41265_1
MCDNDRGSTAACSDPNINKNFDLNHEASDNACVTIKSNRLSDAKVRDAIAKHKESTQSMTMKKTMQRGSHQPIHRYVEASLNEEQDRIRYFAYKKNRIITLIEMPRSKPNQADLMNAYERRHQSRHTTDDQVFERRRQRRASRPSTTDKATNSHTKHYLEHLEARHCDVIILIRDAYGKYAWEASCIFNDCDMVKEIEEVCSSTPNMIDNSPNMIDSASKSESAAGTCHDMMAKALVESQSSTLYNHQNLLLRCALNRRTRK